jgi:hypothetical protein
MTEDTKDPIIQLRKLWADARFQGVTVIEVNGQLVGPDAQDEQFHAYLGQLEAEHAEVILALNELVGLQATTISGVMAALGEAKAVLDRLGDGKAAARIKAAALREAATEMDNVETGPGDLAGIALKSIVYTLKHKYEGEAGQ